MLAKGYIINIAATDTYCIEERQNGAGEGRLGADHAPEGAACGA